MLSPVLCLRRDHRDEVPELPAFLPNSDHTLLRVLDCEGAMTSVIYRPHLGSIRPNGTLRIPLLKHSENGETWQEEIEVGPEHTSYAEWRQAISQKEQHIAALREERMQARAALRQAAAQRRMLKQAE